MKWFRILAPALGLLAFGHTISEMMRGEPEVYADQQRYLLLFSSGLVVQSVGTFMKPSRVRIAVTVAGWALMISGMFVVIRH